MWADSLSRRSHRGAFAAGALIMVMTVMVITVMVVIVTLGLAAPVAAQAEDPRLREVQDQRAEVQAKLDRLLQEISALDAEYADIEAELLRLQEQAQQQQQQAVTADTALQAQIRQSFMRGSLDSGLSILTSDSPQQAAEQAQFLQLLARRNRAEYEGATAAGTRTQVTAEQVATSSQRLELRKQELEQAREEAEGLVAEAAAEEERIKATIAAEAAARAARQPARSTGGAGPSAPVNGNLACPVGQPRSYSDTYGAPRSGGRSHKGTDILAPQGTPIYAYENGTVTRMNSNRLGGISLYLQGDSGNLYYYTHLSGYVGGISAGMRVTAGQHVAHNGMTGNAPVPHLHFEVMPGGGGNVNPYPYVVRACG